MQPVLAGVGLVVLTISWALAVLMYATRPDRQQNRLLALAVFLEGAAIGAFSGIGSLVVHPGDLHALAMVNVYAGAYLMFYVYPRLLSTLESPLAAPFARPWGRALALGVVLTWWSLAFFRAHLFTASPLLDALCLGVLVVLVYALIVAYSAYRRTPSGSTARVRSMAFLVSFGVRDALWVIWIFMTVNLLGSHPAWDAVLFFTYPMMTLVFVLLVTYGVLRTHLFDIDLKIKWTIRRSTLIAIFVGVFFVSAQVAQAFLVTEWGWAVGGIVAGLLLLAINPLQRLAGRVADAAMPNVQNTAEYRVVRKREVYRAAVESALIDGKITEKERDVLAALAEQLALRPTEARGIERGVLQTLQSRVEGVAT